MAPNRIVRDMLLGTHSGPSAPTRPEAPAATYRNRLTARLFSARLDGQIERGGPLPAGTALAVHAARITSFDERVQLARSLRTALQPARSPQGSVACHVPIQREAALANAELIEEVALRLHAPLPVRPRGMARLRLLLADGSGPLYRPARGSLAAQLRGILAAL